MKLFGAIFAYVCYLAAFYFYFTDDMKRFAFFALLGIFNLIVASNEKANDRRL